MKKSDQPLRTVGFLFALSIAFWAQDMATYFSETESRDWLYWATSAAGLFFLADIMCIMWWYAKYIYRIQTTATLSTFFVDFGVCAMFNVAAHRWTDHRVFLTATLIASTLLVWRFLSLYRSEEANDTDRRVLRAARNWVGVAILVSAFLLLAVPFALALFARGHAELVEGAERFRKFFYPVAVATLSGIGIVLTFKFADRIQVSTDIHEAGSQRFVPMELHWPSRIADDKELRRQLGASTRRGLDRFANLFKGGPTDLDHDRLFSRVHPQGDLRVQSYILATPSWTPSSQQIVRADEIEKKAFMVGASHWLDDLVDGRGELQIYNRLAKEEDWGLSLDRAEEIFARIFKDIIVKHTDEHFYLKFVKHIRDSVLLPENRPYLFFSLNRVAIGAAIFGPRVKQSLRESLLEQHNSRIENLIRREQQQAGRDRFAWYDQLLQLLTAMKADPDGLGKLVLGLMTKTVQDMAMASEARHVCFGRSVVYSALYAPLLYFHDVDRELEYHEIVPLESLDVHYEDVVPWMEQLDALIEDDETDTRRESRRAQLRMAFRCFRPNLPEVARDALRDIYDPGPRSVTALRAGAG